jgi:hypoxanthine phosphoribosyltransferase
VVDSDLQVLFDSDRIQKRVFEMAKSISRDYAGGSLHLVGILRGAYPFTRDLSKSLAIPHTVDFISVGSYGAGTESSGSIRLRRKLGHPVKGRDVLIVDDIIDTGTTMNWLVEHVQSLGPRSIGTCCFLDKQARRQVPLSTDYTGFLIDDLFVVGYGLDYQEKYRELPYISWVSPRAVAV